MWVASGGEGDKWLGWGGVGGWWLVVEVEVEVKAADPGQQLSSHIILTINDSIQPIQVR